jgi:hypothetical protein
MNLFSFLKSNRYWPSSLSNLSVAPKSNDRLNSSPCSSNSFSTNNSKNSPPSSSASLASAANQIKTETSSQENSETSEAFKLKDDDDDLTDTHSNLIIKTSPLSSSHQSFKNSKRDKETNHRILNKSDSVLTLADNPIDLDATNRDFYNQLYNQIISSKAPTSPPNVMMPFSSNYFLNQIQNSLFNNNFQSPFHVNKDLNNNNNDYFNYYNLTNNSKLSTTSHSPTSSYDSKNKEAKSCNGK